MRTATATLTIVLAMAALCAGQATSADASSVITDDLVAYFKKAYNPPTHNLGLRDGRYFPYQTPFGGRRIGYRSRIGDKALYRKGLSTEEAEALLRSEASAALASLQAHLGAKYPAKPFEKLSADSREILLDFVYYHGDAATIPDEVYQVVIDEKWDSFINDMLYVRSASGTPDYQVNRAFADRWIFSNKLIPAEKPAKKK